MRRRILKWATLLAVLVLLAISVYWVHVYREVRYLAVHDAAHAAEAIVVLGAAQYNGKPSKVFQARLDHALSIRERVLEGDHHYRQLWSGSQLFGSARRNGGSEEEGR